MVRICSDGSGKVSSGFHCKGKGFKGDGCLGLSIRAGSRGMRVLPTPGTLSEPESSQHLAAARFLFALGFPHRRPPWLRAQGWTGSLHARLVRDGERVCHHVLWGWERGTLSFQNLSPAQRGRCSPGILSPREFYKVFPVLPTLWHIRFTYRPPQISHNLQTSEFSMDVLSRNYL